MTASDIRDLFVTMLTREHGGGRHRWRTAVGEVRIYSLATHPHCNWSITPTGTGETIAHIEAVNDALRERHPILDRG